MCSAEVLNTGSRSSSLQAINMMFAHGAGAPNNAFDRVITRSVGDEGTDGHLSVSGWTTTGETEQRSAGHAPYSCQYGIGVDTRLHGPPRGISAFFRNDTTYETEHKYKRKRFVR